MEKHFFKNNKRLRKAFWERITTRMIKSLSILFGFVGLGEIIRLGLQLPIPGSIIGLLLLTLCLQLGILKEKDVEPSGKVLLKEMAFFFIPPGVGLMLYFDLIKSEWQAILGAIVLSSFCIMATVGFIHQKMDKSHE